MASMSGLHDLSVDGHLGDGLGGHAHAHVHGADATKWQQLANILGLCVAMFVGAFASGLVPACITLSKARVRAFVAFGTGLLLCTALAVIIPEGIHSLAEYEASQLAAHFHSTAIESTHLPEGDHHHDGDDDGDEHDGHHEHHSGNVVGWSLVSGFLLMFLVDNVKWCGGMHGKHGHSHGGVGHTSIDVELESLINNTTSGSGNGSSSSIGRSLSNSKVGNASGNLAAVSSNMGMNASTPNAKTAVSTPRLSTLTIGLLVHSLADGVAVGATKSASTKLTSLDMVLFIAVMMHKLPAAFGLSVVLRGNRAHSSAQVHRELFAFAISAPIGAIATFLVLHEGFLGISSMSALGVAYCLLFSGGTFLYVATVHAMGEFKAHNASLTTAQVVAFCAGCVLPLLIIPAHHH
jgi:zinc transporter 9